MNIFWVLRFCEFFFFCGGGGHHNIGLYLGAISMHFRVFFKVNVQNGEYFFSCQSLEFIFFYFIFFF